jgi:hypothetical protein
MEARDQKRLRLRRELQVAYSAWLTASDLYPSPERAEGRMDTCYAAPSRAKWQEYLAARDRMVLAYAEPAAAA